MKIPERIRSFYPFLGIILIFLSYPSYNIAPLRFFPLFAWFSLVPFFYYIRKAKSLPPLYPRLFLFAVLANLLTYGWMGSFGNTIPYGDVVLLIVFIPTISVILATKILVCEFLSRRYPSARLFVFPAVWLMFDFLQSYGYLAFPWTYWGYSQYPVLPLVQAASITGVYGITFLLVLSNTVLTDLLYRSDGRFSVSHLARPEYVFFATLVAVILVGGTLRTARVGAGEKTDDGDLKLSLIQTCISPWENWMENRYSYLDELIQVTNRAVEENRPDLVIWSESATLEPLTHDVQHNMLDSFGRLLVSYVKALDIPLLTAEIGMFESETGEYGYDYANSAAVIEPDGSIRQQYSKIHLAPIGEWFPYDRWFPGLREYLESMGSSSFTPGDAPFLFSLDSYRYACLICYEGMFPRLTTHYKRTGADFLVNITNDGWSDYYSGHMQHYAASVFRAVENGIWYVRVGNTGYTVIIDPYGNETESIPILEPGYVNGSIDIRQNIDTFYARFGDLFTIAVAGILCLYIIGAEYARFGTVRNKTEEN
ncbi:MAG: apolipoprotein N-acyltransferase [Spirochaetota bacterium]